MKTTMKVTMTKPSTKSSQLNRTEATLLQHAGGNFRVGRGLVGALEQSVTFETSHPTDFPVYARLGNTANHQELEAMLAALHALPNAPSNDTPAQQTDTDAIVFASGMAAANAAYFALLQPGDHVLAQENCYGGIHGFFTAVLSRWGIEVEFAPVASWPSRVRSSTRMAHFESITNPFCRPQDVARICRELKTAWAALPKKAGAESRPLLTLCDNTFSSPMLCKPLALGADIVLESATKYLNGHSDVICGALIANLEIIEAVRNQARLIGGFLNTAACTMLLRGMRTLGIRMQAHSAAGLAFAAGMRACNLVNRVHYGDADLAASFANGFGGMVALEFDPRVDTIAMLEACEFIKNVPSLAGTETSATLPWYSTNRMQPDDEKLRLGITQQLVRFSIGLENVDDIIADVQQAAAAASV